MTWMCRPRKCSVRIKEEAVIIGLRDQVMVELTEVNEAEVSQHTLYFWDINT